MEKQIITELAELLKKMGAGSAVLSAVNSYGDSLTGPEVVDHLRAINKAYGKRRAKKG